MPPGEPSTAPPILGEVRDFLSGLKSAWPELFVAKAKAPSRAPEPAAPAAAAAVERIAPVAADAPPKAALPEGDLVRHFRSRAEHFAPMLGVGFGKLSVKDQRSLWGSCSRLGNLNFSWRLALAPDCVLDYVVAHELAHRAQMNHSRRFWALVERVCPEHKTHRRWLRRHGRALLALRRPEP